jgi:hypothetical protein
VKNWKTTVSSFVTAIASFIAMNADLFPEKSMIVRLSQFVVVGGLVAFGIASKDQ